jgi:hypothetical protein
MTGMRLLTFPGKMTQQETPATVSLLGFLILHRLLQVMRDLVRNDGVLMLAFAGS